MLTWTTTDTHYGLFRSLSGTRGLSMTSERTALLIRCGKEEAEKIRAAAMRERCTLSGYVLHVILNRIASQEKTRVYAPARRSSRY